MSVPELIAKTIDDLQAQASMFGMGIDFETLSLVPQQKQTVPGWAIKWREKQYEADFDTNFDIDRE